MEVKKFHELSLAYDKYRLQELEPPFVLQEFVNHGGNLFKVYVVGEAVKVVRRFSLPDVTISELSKISGLFVFQEFLVLQNLQKKQTWILKLLLPPQPLLERLARDLRLQLGLQLFNLDIIREHGTKDRFYVIDINYFPGYGKMPDYEHIFAEFLLS